VKVVHAEAAGRPWPPRRIAASTVWCDEHERALAADHAEAGGHVGLLALRTATVYTRVMRLRLLGLLCLLAACARLPGTAPPARAHVYLVIVDGLDPRWATPALMPRLFELLARERAQSSFFPAARAVMPARTNPNHVTLLTGVHPDVHGITGNAWWSRVPGARPAKLEDAALIEIETLFTVAETSAPELVTMGVFGKPKLARLFAAVPGRQRAPDLLWSAGDLPPERRDPASGYASDADTVGAAIGAATEKEPDLAVLNLSDVDRSGHAHGPESAEYARAVEGADAAIARLVDALRARGRWKRSVLIVTADHGMCSVAPTPERPRPVISLARQIDAGMTVVADGRVEHVYADGPDATEALARAARVARATPGVAEVLARVAVPGVAALAAAHPDWHLDHERTGELLLVAARGCQFVDPYDPVDAGLHGNHGGPAELSVPLFVTGGSATLRAAPPDTPEPGLVDVAPTIARLLGLRPPRRLDGSAAPAASAGAPLAAVLAQSPH
jgi:predicted AlkP superfamily pyrophosphatase or phosphodiesterase